METMTTDHFMTELGRNSLQAGVLVLAVLLAQWLSGKRLAPRWRCALWLLVVVRLLVPFSFGSAASVFNLLPHWTKSASVPPALVEPSLPMPEIRPAPASPAQVTGPQMNQTPELVQMQKPPAVFPAKSIPSVPAVKPVPHIKPVAHNVWSWPVCLFCIWLVGATVLLGHVLISSIRLARRCAKLRPITEEATLVVLKNCCERLTMRTQLVMVESVAVSSPALHGLFRPRLLLPKGFTAKFSPEELRFVFLHELAHLKRRDLWMNWIMALLQAAHWFNPLVWLGFARWRGDRELACDAMVLEAAGAEQNKEYGQTILRLLENFTHPLRTPGLVGILEDKRQLRRRIGMIATYAPSPRWSLLAAVLIAGLTVIGFTDALSDDSSNSPSASAATNEISLRLTIELRDGSHVIGKSLDDILRFHSSSLGDMKLPLTSIRSIEFSANGETARLTATNGDAFDVQFLTTSLRVETGFGKTELPVKLIRSIKISAAGKPGQMPEGLVALWSGEGNANDSVGGNNGQLVGSVGFAPGKVGQAFDLNNNYNGGDDFQGVRFGGQSGLEGFRPNRGGYVQVADAPDLHFTDSMTVEAWINLRTFSGVNSREIVSKVGGPNLNQGSFTFAINPSTQKAYFVVCGLNGMSGTVYSSTTIPLNQWVHLAGVYDGSAIKIYVNGQLNGTAPWNQPIFPGINPLVIGCTLQNYSYPTSFFNGLIDEVGLYSRALSDSEIKTIYETVQTSVLPPQKMPLQPTRKTNIQTTAASTNVTDFRLTIELRDGSRVTGKSLDDPWRFHSSSLGGMKLPLADIRSIEFSANDETARLTAANGDAFDVQFVATTLRVETSFGKTGLPVKLIRSIKVSTMTSPGQLPSGLVALWSGEGDGNDSIGGNNAILTDISFAEGKVGQAFSLNGFSSWMKIPASPSLDVGKGDGLTITAWIKPSNVVSFRPIMEWNAMTQLGVQLWLGHLPQQNGELFGNLEDDEGNSHSLNSAQGTIVPGQFQYVALTYDKASGVARLFVNGRVVAEQNLGSFTPQTSYDLLVSRRPGDHPGDWTYNAFFAGLLDEIAVYNRALSASEIQAICTEQNNGELPPPPTPSPGMMPGIFRQNGFGGGIMSD